MKIAVVAYKFGTEKEIGEHLGTYHYFIEKMRTLVRQGHTVYVVAPWLSFAKKGSLNVDGVKVLRYYPPLWNKAKAFPVNRFLRYWYIKKTQSQVLSLDKSVDLDVVYVWQARETGFAVARVSHKLRAPFVFRQITAWQWHFEQPLKGLWKTLLLLERRQQQKFAEEIYEKAKKVVFVSSSASKEGLDAGLPDSRTEVLGVGIETDLFKPWGKKTETRKKLGIESEKVILFIGRINFAEKGIGYLLEAMPRIIKDIPQVRLVIVGGGGESTRMQKLISKLGIGEHVQSVGKKPFSDLVKYLNASDVMVVPSVWIEHFGQVTIEAMSCGVPVVTSDQGGSPEINLDGQTGLVVPAASAEKIAEAVARILKDSSLQQRLGVAARERVLQNFTYEILVNKFLNIVSNV